MDSKSQKKQGLLIIGTIIELLTILGYRCFSYLSKYMSFGWCNVLNIIFSGLYGFWESIWLIESIALVILLSVLIKNAFQNRISRSAIMCVCSMLFMSLGIYSVDIVNKHIDDLISGTKLILKTLTKVDFGVLVGWGFVAALSIFTANLIPRLSKTYKYVSPKRVERMKLYRETGDREKETHMSQKPEMNESDSSAMTDNKSDQVEVGSSDEASKDEKNNQAGQPQELHFEMWWMQVIIFLLAFPVFIVAVISVLQSKLVSNIFGDIFKNNTTVTAIMGKTTPIAMICMAVFVALVFAFFV